MCLTIPGRVIAVQEREATVDYGKFGVRQHINTTMVRVRLNDYVLVQGGFVIKVLEPSEARDTVKAWEAVEEHLDFSEGGLF